MGGRGFFWRGHSRGRKRGFLDRAFSSLLEPRVSTAYAQPLLFWIRLFRSMGTETSGGRCKKMVHSLIDHRRAVDMFRYVCSGRNIFVCVWCCRGGTYSRLRARTHAWTRTTAVCATSLLWPYTNCAACPDRAKEGNRRNPGTYPYCLFPSEMDRNNICS